MWLCSWNCGCVSTARLNAAFPLAGNGAELRIIAAAVIGGCSLSEVKVL